MRITSLQTLHNLNTLRNEDGSMKFDRCERCEERDSLGEIRSVL
jgi:hypothetical protein